jgi:hypothetical protein
LSILQAIMRLHGDAFEWKQPPYEYEYEKRPIDLILGSRSLRREIESLKPLDGAFHSWTAPLTGFLATAKTFHLY